MFCVLDVLISSEDQLKWNSYCETSLIPALISSGIQPVWRSVCVCSPSSAGTPACSYAHTESNGVGSSLRDRETKRAQTGQETDREYNYLLTYRIISLNWTWEKRNGTIWCVFIYIEILTGEDCELNRVWSSAPIVHYKWNSDLSRFLFNPTEKTSVNLHAGPPDWCLLDQQRFSSKGWSWKSWVDIPFFFFCVKYKSSF